MTDMQASAAKLRAEAARCERLGAGTYNPTLSEQLLAYAREFRRRAAQIERKSHFA